VYLSNPETACQGTKYICNVYTESGTEEIFHTEVVVLLMRVCTSALPFSGFGKGAVFGLGEGLVG